MYRFNHLHFFAVLVWFNVVMGWFHELGHAVVGDWGGGVIKEISYGWGLFWVQFSVDPTGFWGFLMPFAGGLIVAFSCLMMMWGLEHEDDARIAFYCIGLSQGLYGLAEGSLWNLDLYEWIQPVGLVAMIAGNVLAVFTAKKMWNLEEVDT
jgi:hypothetical protein